MGQGTFRGRLRRHSVAGLLGLIALSVPLAHSEISLDGFTADNLTDDVVLNPDAADTFTITEAMGQRPLTDSGDPNSAAPNLFHSFFRFELDAGQAAMFTQAINDGTDPISNVIARVTGGMPSTLDGALVSNVAGADFWFINPAGVMFGADASVDVGGSFNASAGDFLVINSGANFSAMDDVPRLAVGNPQGFGFLDAGGGSGALSLNGVFLGGPQDRGLEDQFTGLQLHGRSVTIGAEAGVGSDAAKTATGNIALTGLDEVNVFGDVRTRGEDPVAAGNIVLTGGNVTIDGGSLNSRARQSAAAGNIEVTGDRVSLSDNARISTFTSNPGAAGDITITADQIVANVQPPAADGEVAEDVLLRTDSFRNGGQAGSIRLQANDIELRHTQISALAEDGGTQQHRVALVGNNISLSDSAIHTNTEGSAPAGSVEVRSVERLSFTDSGILAATFGTGIGGDVVLVGDVVDIRGSLDFIRDDIIGNPRSPINGFLATSFSDDPDAGEAGDIRVSAGDIILNDGSRFASRNFGGGDAGNVSLVATRTISVNQEVPTGGLEAQENDTVSLSTSNFNDQSNGAINRNRLGLSGSILVSANDGITADNIDLRTSRRSSNGRGIDNPSLIQVVSANGDLNIDRLLVTNETRGSNDGGLTSLRGNNILLIGRRNETGGFTRGVVRSFATNNGSAGAVELIARNNLELRDVRIDVEARQNAKGGAGSILLDAGDSVQLTDSVLVAATQVTKENGEVTPGDVTVLANNNLFIDNSGIVASTSGINDAGEIVIAGDVVRVRRAQRVSSSSNNSEVDFLGTGISTSSILTLSERNGIIDADDLSQRGDAGNLTVSGRVVLFRNSAELSSLTEGPGSGGSIKVTGSERVAFSDSGILAATFGDGTGGGIEIRGDVVNLRGLLEFIRNDIPGGEDTQVGGFVASSFSQKATAGQAGDILIEAGDIILNDGVRFASRNFGGGDAGDVSLVASRTITANQDVATDATDEEGLRGISISSSNFNRQTPNTLNRNEMGLSGSILVSANDGIIFDDVTLGTTRRSSNPRGIGNPSIIEVVSENGDLTLDRLLVSNEARGANDGGLTSLRGGDILLIGRRNDDGGFVEGLVRSFSTNVGSAGSVEVLARGNIELRDYRIDVEARQGGNSRGAAGSVVLMADDSIQLTDSVIVASTQVTSPREDDDSPVAAGDIAITAVNNAFIDNSAIVASTAGIHDAGEILIAADVVSVRGAQSVRSSSNNSRVDLLGTGISTSSLLTLAERAGADESADEIVKGNAGNLNVTGRLVSFSDSAELSSLAESSGNGGSVIVNGSERLSFTKSGILAATFGSGEGGNIQLTGDVIDIRDTLDFIRDDIPGDSVNPINGFIASSFSEDRASGNAGAIVVEAGDIILNDDVRFASRNFGGGDAGDVSLIASRTINANQGVPTDDPEAENRDVISISSSNFNGDSQNTINRNRMGLSGSILVSANDGITFDNVDLRTTRRSSNSRGDGSPSRIEVLSANGDLNLDRLLISNESRGRNSGGLTSLSGNNILLIGRRNDTGGYVRGLVRSFSTNQGDAGAVQLIAKNNLELVDVRVDVEARQAANGGAGSVLLEAGDTIQLTDSVLVAATQVRRERSEFSPGDVTVRSANNVFIDNSAVVASTSGVSDAGDILITAENTVRVRGAQDVTSSSNNSNIFLGRGLSVSTLSDSSDAGSAGTLTVEGRNVELTDAAQLTSFTQSDGDAGSVVVSAGIIDVTGQTQISSFTNGAGNGGQIELIADNRLTLHDSRLEVESVGADAGAAGGIRLLSRGDVAIARSEIVAATQSDLRVIKQGQELRPNIEVTATGAIDIVDSALVASTFGNSNAGNITIESAERIAIEGARRALSQTGTLAGEGIEASASASGNAGEVAITAPELTLTAARISSQSERSGSAGEVSLSGETISLVQGSRVLATTKGGGLGGAVVVKAETLRLNGRGTRISSNAEGSGNGGRVEFDVNDLIVENQAVVETSALGLGESGSIAVQARGNVLLTAARGSSPDTQSSLRTNSEQSQGGQISVGVGGQLRLVNSRITSSVNQSDGNGGRISITPQALFLRSSQILAQANAGNGGNIVINRGSQQNSGLFLIDSASLINAQAQTGVDGDIRVDSPDINANAVVIRQEARIVKTPKLSENLCDSGRSDRSSLVILPDNFVQPAPDGYLSALTFASAETQLSNAPTGNQLLVAQLGSHNSGCGS